MESGKAMAKSFRDLEFWQKAIKLTVIVYQLSKAFAREEIYGLTSQIRRAAVSIPSNIAEGCGRLNTPEYRQFLGIAKGSNFELQTQLVIARELGYGDVALIEQAESLSFEVGKMIYATITTLEKPHSDNGQTVSPVFQTLTTNH